MDSGSFGVEAVFICNRRARLTHPKLIKGSMGAVLTIPMYEFEDVASCYKFLEDNNYTIFLADTRAKNTYFTQKYPSHTAFVMGNERHGISREWYTYPVEMISIPNSTNCFATSTIPVLSDTLINALIKKSPSL